MSQWEGSLMIDLMTFSYSLHHYLLRLLNMSRHRDVFISEVFILSPFRSAQLLPVL